MGPDIFYHCNDYRSQPPSHKRSFAQKCLPQFEQVVCLRTDNGMWLRKPGIACRVVSAQIFFNQSESVPGDS